MWLVAVLLGLAVLLVWHYLTTQDLPPGPFALPYLGGIPVFTVQRVKECRKKYGDIFITDMLGMKIVYLCNYKLIKEAFSRPDIADRPGGEGVHFVTNGVEAGVIMSNGKHWQNARRFLLRNMRDLGMGKTYLERAIQKEATCLVDDFRRVSGSPTLFPQSINVAVLNVVWQMVASKRYDINDEDILRIVKILRGLESNIGLFLWIFFPKLSKMFPKYLRRKWMSEDVLEEMKIENLKLCKELLESHRVSLDPEHPRDIIDEYLLAMDTHKDFATYFSELDLSRIVFDLFNAGSDTVSNTLRWFILFMAKYPDEQRRVQQQIDEVVPRNTLPSYEHKPKLPLVEATVHEVLRKSSLIPLGVNHATQRDVQLGGYRIPKGALVTGATICCHEDPQYWEQPDQFRLERFLDEEGNFVSQREGFLPFSIGRRNCLGEALARMELYIFVAALLQNFTFSAPEGCEVDMEPNHSQPSAQLAKDQYILITTRE